MAAKDAATEAGQVAEVGAREVAGEPSPAAVAAGNAAEARAADAPAPVAAAAAAAAGAAPSAVAQVKYGPAAAAVPMDTAAVTSMRRKPGDEDDNDTKRHKIGGLMTFVDMDEVKQLREVAEDIFDVIGMIEEGTAAPRRDYYTGEELTINAYEAGRSLELAKMAEHGVYSVKPRSHSYGKKTIRGKVIAHWKKNEHGAWIVRWRLVGMEFNDSERSDCFAATPGIAVARILLSQAATMRSRAGHHRRVIAVYDARVAFFQASMDEEMYLIPPAEVCDSSQCWILHKALYGTRRASKLWQKHWQKVLEENQYESAVTDASLYHLPALNDEDDGVDVGVHGDDFFFTTVPERLQEIDKMMTEGFDIKLLGIVGPGHGDKLSFLKRLVTWSKDGYTWEADPVHAMAIIAWAAADTCRPAPTPGTKESLRNVRDGLDTLGEAEASEVRSMAGKSIYLAVDRPDVTYAVREICRDMSAPKVRTLIRVKRLAKYLSGRRTLRWHFFYQEETGILQAMVDSDWAGNTDDRKSVMRCCIRRGEHLIEFSVSGQNCQALSSAEAEFYAHSDGGARLLQSRNLFRALGVELIGRIDGDNTAAQSLCRRRGVGKIRHLEAKDLWIQDKVEKKELILGRVPTADNMSDIGTKYVPAVTLDRHLKALHLTVEERTGGATDPEGDEPHG